MRKFPKNEFLTNGHISAERRLYNCRVPTHSHEFFELEYIISGEGAYCVDGTDYEIKQGALFFITPVNFHSVDMKNTDFYNVMFSADMCKMSILSRLFAGESTALCEDEESRLLISSIISEICKNCDNTEYSSLLLETLIYKILTLSESKGERELSSDIARAQLYIMENFKRRLTLSEVSEHTRLSESHFSRKFLSETGKNFKQYLDELRFAYAEKLLVYSDLTVMQICNECGFDDYPNFIRRFGTYCGKSPSEYRKTHHRDNICEGTDANFKKL